MISLLLAFFVSYVTPAAAPVTVQHYTYNDVKLTVLDQGAGPAIVMIPSLGRPASDFDDLAGRLAAAGYRVLRLQPRGIAGSAGPMQSLTMHNLAEDVAHVITDSGARQAIVLGHDDGNRFARATAAYFPALVTGVILINAGGKAKPEPAALVALGKCFDAALPEAEHLAAIKTAFFAPGNEPPAAWGKGWYPETAMMERNAVQATPMDEWWTAGRTVPILVIQGDQDPIAPKENVELLQKDVGPRAEIHHIAHAAHALLPEQPDQVASIILAYLKQHA